MLKTNLFCINNTEIFNKFLGFMNSVAEKGLQILSEPSLDSNKCKLKIISSDNIDVNKIDIEQVRMHMKENNLKEPDDVVDEDGLNPLWYVFKMLYDNGIINNIFCTIEYTTTSGEEFISNYISGDSEFRSKIERYAYYINLNPQGGT